MKVSCLIIPGLQVGFSLLNHVLGPQKTIAISHQMANVILDIMPQKAQSFLQDDLNLEQKVLQRFSLKPWIACLETACSFEQILAFHGEPCVIRIGKCFENGQIYMHAWVESASASYFKDERYEECFVQ